MKTGDIDVLFLELDRIQELAPIAPRILGAWIGGYAMELLQTRPPDLRDACVIARMLRWAWDQSGEPDLSWTEAFYDRFGFHAPGLVRWERDCLIHGDPTVANLGWRSAEEPVLMDPRGPGNGIPSKASVDRGKILQSLLGWESAIVQIDPVVYEWPFGDLHDGELWSAIWWARVHLLRIAQRENRSPTIPGLLQWATQTSSDLSEVLR